MNIPFHCTKCGSRNHDASVCSKSGSYTFVPTDDERAAMEAVAEPEPTPVASKVAEPMFEPGERFKGCPPICTATNLPSFETDTVLNKWRSERGLDDKVKRMWQCETCGKWHYQAQPRGPSGSSSSTERNSELPPNFKPFVTKATRRLEEQRKNPQPRTGDLPKQADQAKELDAVPAKPLPSVRELANQNALF